MASDDEQPTASLVGGGSSDAAAYDGDEVVPPLPPSFASDEKPESPAPEDPYGALDEPMSGEGTEDVTPDSVKKRAEEQDEKEGMSGRGKRGGGAGASEYTRRGESILTIWLTRNR